MIQETFLLTFVFHDTDILANHKNPTSYSIRGGIVGSKPKKG